MSKVAVIGGGAAGLIAAGMAAQNGCQVTLFEKNSKVGRKIAITGKGRCNVTNACDVDTFMRSIPCNSRFLYSAVMGFDMQAVQDFFEALGVPLKIERGNRVFPVSDRATDIVDALFRFVKREKVKLIFEPVTDIQAQDGQITGVVTAKGFQPFDQVILATGGVSYPGTGSTGDGYRFAQKLGHTLVPPKASLVPLCAKGDICPRLQGLSLKNVAVAIWENGKKKYEDFGEMMFTHFGVTGPVILSASSHMRDFSKNQYELTIDLKPALDEKTLDKRILSDFREKQNSDFINALGKLLPKKLIPVVVDLSGIPPHMKVNSITKQQREGLVKLLKQLRIPITGPRPIAEAIVTSGGISVKEISPKTMESKIVKGLYFAGEIIDVDGYTGGFNLQIAWSTGYRAGISVG
jgi:predicted Rossmann fold flavoprotein